MSDYTDLLAVLAAEQERTTLDARHCYWRDKKRVPGVTTIIKQKDAPELDNWKVKTQVEGTARAAFANPPTYGEDVESYVGRLVEIAKEQYEHERIADEAARIGSDVHRLIEHACLIRMGREHEEPKDVCEEALFRFAGWEKWADDVSLKPLAVEQRVYNAEDEYAGTLDLIADVEGALAVLDWKSSPRVYDSHRLQSAAYRMAISSMTAHGGVGLCGALGYVVRVPRDGGDIEMVNLGPLDVDDIEAFAACLRLYRWDAEQRKAYRKGKAA